MQTPERFRSLAALLASQNEPPGQMPENVADDPSPVEFSPVDSAEEDVVREIRLFRARLGEALDEALAALLADIASEVLARELQLAPAQIATIVHRALERYCSEEPLRVRLHPDDLCDLRVATIADTNVRRGDAILELRNVSIDAGLGVRLESVLRALR